jgi:catechol 2,3-dioxygenase-like lactoylglutathione lyase family enzyme
MDNQQCVTLVLWVDDYDKAIDFYCEKTQLFYLVANTTGSGLRNVVLRYQRPTAPFEFVLYLATNTEQLKLVGRQCGDTTLLILPVENCIEVFNKLNGIGVVFIGEPIELPYGVQASFNDPFGNKICLSEMF